MTSKNEDHVQSKECKAGVDDQLPLVTLLCRTKIPSIILYSKSNRSCRKSGSTNLMSIYTVMWQM